MCIQGRAQTVLRLAVGAATALLVAAAGSAGSLVVHASAKAPAETVDVTILTPRDGVALNAPTLEIQALASARRAGRADDDVWTGWTRVDLAIDGVPTQTLDPTVCRGPLAAGFRVDLTGLVPGAHVATLTAHKKSRGNTVRGTASLTFVIDPALPVRETNRIEEAATPKPFACLSTPDFDRDDDERADDSDGRFATLRGSFVPNALSTGLDLRRDRVVLAIDDQLVVIEPGAFVCRAHNRCRFTDTAGALVRSVRLEQKGRGRWTFTIATRHRPWAPRSLFLRIGANWGGLDFAHDQYVAALALALDPAFAGQATIGSAGGTVQTTDAAGVVIRLIVPPGALTRDTLITATPLAAPPLVGQTADLHFGVEFEPAGLVFAEPAQLEIDFGVATRPLTNHDLIYLVTSPLSRIPLVGNSLVGSTILTASLSHFSPVIADGLAPLFGNLVDWDPRLIATGHLTFTELATAAEALRVQLLLGCTPGPGCAAVDAAYADLIAAVSNSIDSLVSGCSADVANPTRAAFDHWKTLVALAQGLGLDATGILDCARNVLDALVTKVAADGLANPTDAAVTSLDDLENQALGLAFATVASRAKGKKHDVLEKVIDLAGATAAGDPSTANLQRMIGLKARAQGFGFADLERRVLVQSVPAARGAISRLQSACDVSSTAPATEVAKELARTWVAFVNLDASVAPTLSADFQRVVDNCGGQFLRVEGGPDFKTFIFLATPGLLAQTADPPVHFAYADAGGTGDMRISVSGSSVKTVAVDVTLRTVATGFGGEVFAGLNFQFPRPGTLKIEVNHSWLTDFFEFDTRRGGGVIATVSRPGEFPFVANCLSVTCGFPDGPAVVTIPVVAGPLTIRSRLQVLSLFGHSSAGSGRVFTLTYTPAS